MGHIRLGYGSEWHLLRWLGRHRRELNRRICNLVGIASTNIEWLDFRIAPNAEFGDAELEQLDFIGGDHPVQELWKKFWPQTGTPPNWDAVGIVHAGHDSEWILVEAKANLAEIETSSQASGKGLELIENALMQTKKHFQAQGSGDWTKRFYQYANRLAMLYFLAKHNVRAHLVFIYFCGDRGDTSRVCPQNEAEWLPSLQVQSEYLGIQDSHILHDRIHRLFLHVHGQVESSDFAKSQE